MIHEHEHTMSMPDETNVIKIYTTYIDMANIKGKSNAINMTFFVHNLIPFFLALLRLLDFLFILLERDEMNKTQKKTMQIFGASTVIEY